ncbi:MAG: ribosome-binding factor A [Herpetosiphonaceae bacterium]|nr:MAG: ribosome-binding factor A [Herpetosiphonaceae bacterium]
MASPRRQEQVAEQIQHLLGDLIQRQIKDPRLGFVTVTSVTMSPDLLHAKVGVSVMGSEEERRESLAVLERAKGFLRREIGRTLRLRMTPDLHFELDTALEVSDRIHRLLRQIEEERRMNPPKLDDEEGE